MHKLFLFLLLTIAGHVATGQEYVYANTDNLLLRDRPEKEYDVFGVLHAPCRLEVIPYSTGYETKAIKDWFYHVQLSVWFEKTKSSYTGYGWVEKKYVVSSHDKITAQYADSAEAILFNKVPVSRDNPPKLNCRSYPYPKYKGGEKNFDTANKKKYQKGKLGGCYYINAKGRKVYVDAKLCK